MKTTYQYCIAVAIALMTTAPFGPVNVAAEEINGRLHDFELANARMGATNSAHLVVIYPSGR